MTEARHCHYVLHILWEKPTLFPVQNATDSSILNMNVPRIEISMSKNKLLGVCSPERRQMATERGCRGGSSEICQLLDFKGVEVVFILKRTKHYFRKCFVGVDSWLVSNAADEEL